MPQANPHDIPLFFYRVYMTTMPAGFNKAMQEKVMAGKVEEVEEPLVELVRTYWAEAYGNLTRLAYHK